MVSTTSKNWKDWPTPPILEDTVYDNHNAAGVLRGLKKGKKIGNIWFHADELEMGGKAWMRAAQCSVRDSMQWRAFIEEARKFAAWWRQIKDEQQESGLPQAMMIEPKDWPSKQLFDQAISAIEHGEAFSLA